MLRRFENESEQKFWQIEDRELTLRVTFGKIGAKGQIQLHRCANESELETETDRLVRDKVKKGFVEKKDGESSEAPAAPAAPKKAAKVVAPTPAPAAPKADHAPERRAVSSSSSSSALAVIDTSSRLIQTAAPNPASGRDFKPKSVSETWGKLHARYAQFAQAIDAGIKKTDASRDRLVAVKTAYASETPPAKLDVETEAAAYRLMSAIREYRDEHAGDLFARYWLAKEGGEFALRAIAAAGNLSRNTHGTNAYNAPTTLSLENKPFTAEATYGKTDESWIEIRHWVASLGDAELAKVRALVVDLRKGQAPSTRVLLDAAIGDRALCAEDVDEIAKTDNVHLLWPALASLEDVDKITAVIDKLTNTWALTQFIWLLPTVIVRNGPSAARVIELMLGKGLYGTDHNKNVAAALALVRTAEVAEAMVKRLDAKELRAIATEFLQSAPSLAVAPLARAAVGKGALADLAKSVLATVVSKVPDDARKLAESSSDAERAVIEHALDRFENLVDADPGDLPRVLAEPPWLQKKRAEAPPVVAGLEPLDHEKRVVWQSAAQQKEFKNEHSHYAQDASKEKAVLKEIADAAAAKRASSIGSWKLLQLPKESGIHTLETAPLEVFSWYYGGLPHAFIGRYELDALPAVLRYATIDPTNAIEALSVVDAPEVAPLMADAHLRLKKTRAAAQAWFARFPEAAAIGLIPNALGEKAGSRPPAIGALRWLASHGKRDVIEKVAARYGDETRAAMKTLLDFDPIFDLPAKLPKMPSFFNAGALPRPRLRGQKKVLPVSAVDALGTMLAFARVDEPYAGIAQVKEACEPSSLAELAWELFQTWLVAGAPNKENWAFLALAHFGDDECARKLTPLVRAWPGEAAHARAVIGLDVLQAIGTDVALMHLHGIAQKLKFKGLQEKAREKIDQIAEARGLTAAELADRLVPDLGLDDDGSLELDFGPRKFKVAFDEMLKPIALDESGKRVNDLPKPNKSDDAEKSAAAVATWKALKKDSKTVAQGQLLRLELAMCAQRRWTPEAFDQFFVQHPLMIHLVRRLIWGTYDAKDALDGTFRVVEDRTYANSKDERFDVPAGAQIGLVHRLEMSQKDADAWGQVLGDYEIMQPFSQLSREALRPTDAEKESTSLERVTGITVPTGKILGLDNRGWRRGPPQDAGVVCWYEKPLGEGWVVCMDLDPGIYTGMISESPQQKVGKVVVAKNADSWRKENLRKLGELSPIEFSELARDLESLRP